MHLWKINVKKRTEDIITSVHLYVYTYRYTKIQGWNIVDS